jgi:Tc5 transposase DNA-binding domain
LYLINGEITGRTPINCKPGPQPILIQLSKEVGLKVDLEEAIYQHLKNQARRGLPLKRENLLELVINLLKAENMPNPFPSGVPGKSWFYAFKARHPDLALRTAEHHSLARAALNEGAVRGWFKLVLDYCTEEAILHILHDGSRVLNCDETPFKVCQTSGFENFAFYI